jgi:hypothetical protein
MKTPSIEVLTAHNWPKYLAWYHEALHDPVTSRFMVNGAGYVGFPPSPPTGDWDSLYLLRGRAMVGFLFNRAAQKIALECFANGATPWARAVAAGAAMIEMLPYLRRYLHSMRTVTAGCAATNKPSVRLLTRLFGPPWGREPGGLFDPEVGWVDALRFSLPLEQFLLRADCWARKRSGS